MHGFGIRGFRIDKLGVTVVRIQDFGVYRFKVLGNIYVHILCVTIYIRIF